MLYIVSFICGLGNIAQENTAADILVEDQLRSPLDTVKVDQERKLHNQIAQLSASHCGMDHQRKLCLNDTTFCLFFVIAAALLDQETE